jgi:hypothetical protein
MFGMAMNRRSRTFPLCPSMRRIDAEDPIVTVDPGVGFPID